MEDIIEKKFKRINQHAQIGGVCGGLAYYLEMQVWIVRLLVFCTIVFAGFGLIAYILVALFAPEWENDPIDYEEICE